MGRAVDNCHSLVFRIRTNDRGLFLGTKEDKEVLVRFIGRCCAVLSNSKFKNIDVFETI